MSNAVVLKCPLAHCTFETKTPAALATHLQHSTPDGSRWICLAEDCKTTCCSTQAMEIHHNMCTPYKAFCAKRKYGKGMHGRLGKMAFRREAQMNGTEPDGPPAGFSTPNRKPANKNNLSKSKKSKAKSLKPRAVPKQKATPKQRTTPKPRSITIESDPEDDHSDEADSSALMLSSGVTPSRNTRASRLRRSTLKSNAGGKGDTEDDDDSSGDNGEDDGANDAFEPKRAATLQNKARTTRNSLAVLKRKAVDEDKDEEDDGGLASKKPVKPSRKSQAKLPVSNKRPKASISSGSKVKIDGGMAGVKTSSPPDPFSQLALAQPNTGFSSWFDDDDKAPVAFNGDVSGTFTPFNSFATPSTPSTTLFSPSTTQSTPYATPFTPFAGALEPFKFATQSAPNAGPFDPFNFAYPSIPYTGMPTQAAGGNGDGGQFDGFNELGDLDEEMWELMQ